MSIEHLQALVTSPESFPLNGEALAPTDQQVLRLTWDSLTEYGQYLYARRAFQAEGQAEGGLSNTFRHELAVGGLILAATENTDAAVAAAQHDTGKNRPEVRKLITQTTAIMDFSPEDFATIRSHAPLGGKDLRGAIEDPALNRLASFVATYHHTPDSELPQEETSGTRDINNAVRVVDALQAILLDWGRPYKAKRWQRDGWVDEDFNLNMDAVMDGVTPAADKGRSYMGVPVETFVETVVARMPTPAKIQGYLEEFSRQAA